MGDTRAEPSADLYRFLYAQWGTRCDRVRDLGGSQNLNLLLDNGSGRVVARIYRQHVCADRLTEMQNARRALAASGVPCAHLIPTRDDSPFAEFEDRLVEVERFIEHDARMNTPNRLRTGLPHLGQIHSVLRELPVASAGRDAGFVNHIDADQVLPATARGTTRIRSWQPTAGELHLADLSDQLAEAVAAGEADLSQSLRRQVVHGDFWDNNVYFRGEELVQVADFDFMGERARIDDLALTLYFADAEFNLQATDDRIAALRSLVNAYESGLDQPLTSAEREALPWAFARQPLWGIGGWVVRLRTEDEARRHANRTADGVVRALRVVDEINYWTAHLTCRW